MASKRRLRRQRQRRDEAEREKRCAGKRGYATRAVAIEMARRTRQHAGGHYTPYCCAFCGLYHVGHTPTDALIQIRERRERRREVTA